MEKAIHELKEDFGIDRISSSSLGSADEEHYRSEPGGGHGSAVLSATARSLNNSRASRTATKATSCAAFDEDFP